jgi:uncharacterized protein YeaC (DUF1315 family)
MIYIILMELIKMALEKNKKWPDGCPLSKKNIQKYLQKNKIIIQNPPKFFLR